MHILNIALISILYFELLFCFLSYFSIGLNLFYIVLIAVLFGNIFSLLIERLKDKLKKIIFCIVFFIIGIYFSFQYCLNSFYGFYFQFSLLSLAGQALSFMDDAKKVIFDHFGIILLFLLPSIFSLFLSYSEEKIKKKHRLVISTISLLLYLLCISNFSYDNIALSIHDIGVLNTFIYDCFSSSKNRQEDFVFEESKEEEDIMEEEILEEVVKKEYGYHQLEFDFDKLLSDNTNDNIATITKAIQNQTPTKENDYTGLFEGKNLIWIMGESFNSLAVSEELTPNLYYLIHNGFDFENYYSPTIMSTIGGEMSQLTGLYPDHETTPNSLQIFRSGENYFPLGIATVFKEEGYKTFAYHDSTYTFQDRDDYLKSLGFDNYMGCGNGLEKRMACSLFPASDIDMVNVTIDDYINEDQFMVFYAFVSGHGAYDENDEICAPYLEKAKEYYGELNISSEASSQLMGYVSQQMLVDEAIGTLIDKLKEAGKWEDTVIVFVPDHHPYYLTSNLSMEEYNSISTYERDSKFEIYHSNLVIFNASTGSHLVNKVASTIDVLPTIYNLFGIQYDSRLFAGHDILSSEDGLAVTVDFSWISNYGKYNNSTSTFYESDIVIGENRRNELNKKAKYVDLLSRYIFYYDYYDLLWKYRITSSQ